MLLYYNLFYIIFYSIWCYSKVMSTPTSYKASDKEIGLYYKLHQNENEITDMKQNKLNGTVNYVNSVLDEIHPNISRSRVKRQSSGAGKFVEAANMPQIKLLRLILQMFKNGWDSAYVGGAHPLHHNIPKAIVALYKQKVVEFFIPDVGEEKV